MNTGRVARTVILIFLSFGMLWIIYGPQRAQAINGTASFNIITLGAVPGVDRVSYTAAGAIDALTPNGRDANIPWAHPKRGATSPYFYSTSYAQIDTWSTYTNLVLNGKDIVILNPWGDLLPVPCGYGDNQWIDIIAQAMTQRKLTWVNAGGGYPFYYTYNYDDYQSCPLHSDVLGAAGLQELFKAILGANSISLTPPSGLVNGDTSGVSGNLLGLGWPKISSYARMAQPSYVMRSTDFANQVLFPIYTSKYFPTSGPETDYWEGAVIGFQAPGVRVSPSNNQGAGAFVFFDTSQTFDSNGVATSTSFCPLSQCAHYFEGYVATAAALLTETTQFTPKYNEGTYKTFGFGTLDLSVKVNPVVLGWSKDPQTGTVTVRLGFGIYAGELIPSTTTDAITDVWVYMENPTDNSVPVGSVLLKAQLDRSFNGQNQGLQLVSNTLDPTFVAGIDTTLFIAGLWGPTEAFATIAQGVELFSQWNDAINGHLSGGLSTSGVNSFSDIVYFNYQPDQVVTQFPNNYVSEIQSFIITDIQIPSNVGSDWLTVPISYDFHVNTRNGPHIDVPGEAALAVWMGSGNQVTIFHDDFEQGIGAWTTGEDNPSSDSNWGVLTLQTVTSPRPNLASPEAVGHNSVYGGVPNIVACNPPGGPTACYDKNENAWMKLDLTHFNLPAYQSVTLQYDIDLYMYSGDYLTIDFGGSIIKTYQGNGPPGLTSGLFTDHFSVPTSAPFVRFRFVSNGDNNVWYGPYIDDVILTGVLPNDAGTGGWAGNSFSSATSIIPGGTGGPNQFYGYVFALPGHGGLEDWYQLNAPIHTSVRATLSNLAPGENLLVAFYNPSSTLTCNASPCSGTDITVHTMSSGNWRLRVFAPNSTSNPLPSSYGSYLFSLQAVAIQTLTASFTTSNSQTVNAPVTFTLTASGGTPPYTYALTYGDGSTDSVVTMSNTYTISHTYTTQGAYSVTLTVTDVDGWTVSQTQTITVSSFSVTTNPSSSAAYQGQQQPFTVTVTDLSSTGSVTVTLTGTVSGGPTGTCPTGAGCPSTSFTSTSLTAAPGAPQSTTIAVSVPYGAPCGSQSQAVTYTVTVRGASGTETHTATIQILVFHRGDLNKDGVVNISDLVIVASHFGQTFGSPGWDPRADVNGDGIVDITDLVFVAGQFGLGC